MQCCAQPFGCAVLLSVSWCKVYAIAFNNPYGDKVATGSFDKTARLWDVNTGDCCYQLRGELDLPASVGCVVDPQQCTQQCTCSWHLAH